MLELTKKDYLNQTLPSHFEVYNLSSEPIKGLKTTKLLELPRLHRIKFEKGKITKKELEEQYYRGLESRGQQLISVDYGSCTVMVCGCETYKHDDNCAMEYLKRYMKLKNHIIERYE